MKTRFAQPAPLTHRDQTGADEADIAAHPFIPLQLCKVANSVNGGDGDDPASALGQPFQSSLVDALMDQLRETRMKRFRPH